MKKAQPSNGEIETLQKLVRDQQRQLQARQNLNEGLRQTFRSLKASVKEARYAVVTSDMQAIVDLLNRLDLLADDARGRLDSAEESDKCR
jgi:ABC-type phosphate transport system auxiliary subunit